MTRTLEAATGINSLHDRTQTMTLYTRAFFRSVSADRFTCIIEDARTFGQQRLVERLYTDKVIGSIVRAVLSRIDRTYYGNDRINDYIHDATVALVQIAWQGKFDLSKSAGEIASYICLWIEQRVKRVAKKDQRWQLSLSETEDCLETPACSTDIETPFMTDGDFYQTGEYSPAGTGGKECSGTKGEEPAVNIHIQIFPEKNRVATYALRKSNDYISSLFNSK